MQTDSGFKRVYPFSVIEKLDAADYVLWIEITDNNYIQPFKSLAKLVMERNRVGDK